MKIGKIDAGKFKLELVQPIEIALGTIPYSETVIVRIETEDGLLGYGEGSGIPFVTGENSDMILSAVQELKKVLIGMEVFAIADIHKKMDAVLCHNTSAKAAIDIALYDLMGKYLKMPLYRYLGGVRKQLETDMTIGISSPERMSREAVQMVKNGFHYIKVKAGIDPQQDIRAVQKIREAVGEEIHMKVDANQGWHTKEAVGIIEKMASFGVDIIEQPCKDWDIEALAFIRSKTTLNIMADESCFSPSDAMKLIKNNAVDSMNIKLMKCGGIYPAIQINTIAEAAGVICMVGCMMESRLGITAGASLIASADNIIFSDLDSFLYLRDQEQIQGGFESDGPYLTLTDAYGLGVQVTYGS